MEPEPERPKEEETDLLAAKYPLNPETCYYTMYVVASQALKTLTRLTHHEDALAKGLLTEVVRVEDGVVVLCATAAAERRIERLEIAVTGDGTLEVLTRESAAADLPVCVRPHLH